MRLGFDLDEVVVDLTAEMEIYLKEKYGLDLSKDVFQLYKFADCVFHEDRMKNDAIVKELIRLADDAEFQLGAKPVEGAAECLRRFKRSGHKLYFITHRPKENRSSTFKWMRDNRIPYDEVFVTGKTAEKGLLGRKLKLDMYVDDLEIHLDSMLKYKRRWPRGLLLMDRPWNSNLVTGDRFVRVKSWSDIFYHVNVHNVIKA